VASKHKPGKAGLELRLVQSKALIENPDAAQFAATAIQPETVRAARDALGAQ